MAILVIFSRTKTAKYYEVIGDRLKACYETLKFFNGSLFFPQEAEVWFSAPSEALGGTLSRTFPAQNPFEATNAIHEYLKSLQYPDLRKTLVVFRGSWDIDGTKLAGYFSIQNNLEWRRVYGDLEISAYAKGEVEDIVDALWLLQDSNGLIDRFMHDFHRHIQNLSIGLSQVVFCRGIWTREDPSNIMAIYLTGARRSLLRLFYDALRESKEPDVVSKARPLNTSFLLDILEENKDVEIRINERLKRTMVAEVPIGSALYIAKERESFGKLFRDISSSVLKPAFAKLPKEEEVRERVEDGLREYHEED
jgi:hypothetical protein